MLNCQYSVHQMTGGLKYNLLKHSQSNMHRQKEPGVRAYYRRADTCLAK